MRVALAQILATDDPAENLELVADHAALAAQQGATVVVFPEATMCRFGVSLKPVAEPLDGPWASAVREITYPGTSLREQFDLGTLPAGRYRALVTMDAGHDAVFGGQYTLKL